MKELYAHSPNDNGQWHNTEEHFEGGCKAGEIRD